MSISFERSALPDQLLDAGDGPPLGVWLVLKGRHLARIVFADARSRRYFVRDVPLDDGLDEVGREKVTQILLASFQAFAERRVEDTPIEQAQKALSEPADSSSRAVASAAAAANEEPRNDGLSTTLVPTTDSSAPASHSGATSSRAGGSESLSWALGAWYSLAYRGPAGFAHGLGASLEGWSSHGGWGLGLVTGGRYQLPHTESGEHVDLRVHAAALRVSLVLAVFDDSRPTWHLGVGFGWDWITFEPEEADPNVELRSSEQTERPLVITTLGRFVSLGSLRLGAAIGAELALEKLHYDVVVDGQAQRTLTPWMVAPQALVSLGWH